MEGQYGGGGDCTTLQCTAKYGITPLSGYSLILYSIDPKSLTITISPHRQDIARED